MDHEKFATEKARLLWFAAVGAGALGFAVGLIWANTAQGPGLDWIWAVAAFGFGVIVYNIAFFALCSIFIPGMAAFVEDDTKVQGDNVGHVVRHVQVGDEKVDFYIRNYASARAITAVAIVSVVITTIAMVFF